MFLIQFVVFSITYLGELVHKLIPHNLRESTIERQHWHYQNLLHWYTNMLIKKLELSEQCSFRESFQKIGIIQLHIGMSKVHTEIQKVGNVLNFKNDDYKKKLRKLPQQS